MKKGFTLIELIVVVAIIVIVSAIGLVSLLGKRSSTDLTSTTAEAVAMLREAESRSMAQAQGVSWGVRFGNPTSTAPFYAIFFSAYSSTTTVGYYRLPSTIGYTASSVPLGTSLDVTFSQITGLASASTTVKFSILNPSKSLSVTSSTISITSSGVISY
jgi:prepilin-type N-terminal cleavage/methylation domain-containing protein